LPKTFLSYKQKKAASVAFMSAIYAAAVGVALRNGQETGMYGVLLLFYVLNLICTLFFLRLSGNRDEIRVGLQN
jgi:hypothetical protein